ncbi:MAG: hypothetical protein Q7T13_07270 [Polaromonas sp.]|nr:hypothetical protein [Polaromonas sp.]
MEVLLNHVKLDWLNAKERAVIEDFRLQMAQVKRPKDQRAG